ncbi:hypothetical protein AAGW05_15055 [Arthrobacter sp. LAPM80]|uniref:hypothetical protein n=1 Tax=Arthrobacter sp. LAPM80 TaxID=3141788 RepID=UPI00398A9C53
MPQPTRQNLEVIVDPSEDKYALLNEAEAVLRSAIEAQRLAGTDSQNLRGIMVTRHDSNRYTLRLDETVPYGESRETTLYRA